MPFRVTFFWQQQSSKLGGWSENFWSSLSDVSSVQTAALALRTLMDNAKGAQVVCNTIRISDAATFRNVQNVLIPGASTIPTTPSNDADYPSTALQLKMKAAGNYSTTQWFRGIPDANVSNSGQYNPIPSYVSKISTIAAEITNSSKQWSVRVLDRTVLKKVVSNLAPTTGIVTCTAHGYGPAGTTLKVRIQGFASPKVANKVWRITVIDADTFQLNFWQSTSGPVSGNNPTARAQVYTYIQVSGLEVVRATSHRTGRPIGLLGGRRRRRAV